MNFWQSLRVIILLNLLGLFTINIKSAQANPQQCYQQALPTFANSYTVDLVAWMCQGATSTIPAQCFKAAFPTFYNDQVAKRAAMVCKGATSTAPGKCFIEIIGTFYNSESVERAFKLCKVNSNTSEGYPNNSNSNNRNSGFYGAWAVQNGEWNGILRMQGNSGRMILVSNRGAAVEQKMILKLNPQGGYILDGEVLTQYVRGRYNADNFYIQQFSKDSINVKNCDDNSQCNSVTLVYLGK
ncbi:MAG: hypothetical protein KME40_15505 [Komarekiella atlantica HA4396-MV6]|jgi:hypothetical protein|nr:hypothetical protein [Komarekiella atlantica HA4396-MV6]